MRELDLRQLDRAGGARAAARSTAGNVGGGVRGLGSLAAGCGCRGSTGAAGTEGSGRGETDPSGATARRRATASPRLAALAVADAPPGRVSAGGR